MKLEVTLLPTNDEIKLFPIVDKLYAVLEDAIGKDPLYDFKIVLLGTDVVLSPFAPKDAKQ